MYKKIIKTFSDRLKTVRYGLADEIITQRQMADYIGVSLKGYRLVERGHSMPRVDRLITLCNNLAKDYPWRRINLNWLVLGEGEPFYDGEVKKSGPKPGSECTVILKDGKIVNASHGVERLTGFSVNELISRPSLDFLAFDSRRDIDKFVEDDTDQPYEATLMRKRGGRLAVKVWPENVWWGDAHFRVLEIKRARAKRGKTSGKRAAK